MTWSLEVLELVRIALRSVVDDLLHRCQVEACMLWQLHTRL